MRRRRSTTAKPRWTSDAVGSMPSFTRNGVARSILVRSSGSEMTSTAFAVRRRSCRSTSTTGDGNKRARPPRRPPPRSLSELRGQSAVDRDDRAVDERGGGERQAEHHVRYLFRVAVAAQRDAPAREPLLRVVGNRRGHPRADRTGADAVDRDAHRSELARHRSRQADDAVLAHRWARGYLDSP